MFQPHGRDADSAPARHYFGRVGSILMREVMWADDPDMPIPYRLAPETASCLHAAAWDLNEYCDHLARLHDGQYDPN